MSSEIVPKAPYLIVRKGRFYFDMRVPVDVAGAFKRKLQRKSATIRISLHTEDRRQAQRLAAKHLSECEQLFEELRRADDVDQVLANKIGRRDLSKLSRAELQKLAVDFYGDVLKPAAISPPIDSEDQLDLVAAWTDTLAHVQDRRDEEGNERIQSTVDHILLMAGWPSTRTKVGSIRRHLPSVDVDRSAEQYGALMDMVRRASVEGSRLALAELKGMPYEPTDPLFATLFDRKEANDKLGPLLSEALNSWKEGSGVRGGRKPRPLTAKEAASAVRRFTELNGDIRVGEITKRRVQEFASAISKLPAHLSKSLSEMALPEILTQDLSSFPQRAPATINKAFTLLSAIVEDARKRSDLEDASSWPNHFPSAWIEEDDNEERDRDPFSADDLKRIFVDGPVHGLGIRQKGGRGDAQYWLPLLGLLTGARLSELGQLRVCDVGEDDGGIAFIGIGTTGGRTVKTRSSIRKVPIHPDLLRMGFLEYVEGIEAEAGRNATLWPLLSSAKGGAWTAAFSKWFGNYLRRRPLSITDRRKVFHSFRHLFKDMCRDAGLSEDVHDALTGHAPGKSVGRSYGAGHSVARLHVELSKIVAPVDLSHLHAIKVRKGPGGF